MTSSIKEQAEALVKCLEDHKAENIILIDVKDRTIIADYFVICSGRSVTHVKSLADDLDDFASQNGYELRRSEGYQAGRWIVMDYANILVHIFHPEERQFYDMERLWAE